MSNATERVLRDVLNAFRSRGLDLDWAGTDSHLFLRGVVEAYDVVVGVAVPEWTDVEPREGDVSLCVYDLGDFDEGRQPVTTVPSTDCWTAAQLAWLLGVAYREGRNAPKPLVG